MHTHVNLDLNSSSVVSKPLKRLTSKRFNGIFVIELYPRGKDKNNINDVWIRLKIVGLQWKRSKFQAKHEIIWKQTGIKKSTIYDYAQQKVGFFHKLCTYKEFIKYNEFELNVKLNILREYDHDGNIIGFDDTVKGFFDSLSIKQKNDDYKQMDDEKERDKIFGVPVSKRVKCSMLNIFFPNFVTP